MGYQTKACIDSFAGTNLRLLSDQVKAKAEFYQNKLRHDVEELSKVGVPMLAFTEYFIEK